MPSLLASCHCKAFSHILNISDDVSLPLEETTCSCKSCQHRTGQLAILTLSANKTNTLLTDSQLAKLCHYDQQCGFSIATPAQGDKGDSDDTVGLSKYSAQSGGTIITTFFCGTCGTKIYLQVAKPSGEVEIGSWMLGCLDQILLDGKLVLDIQGHHFLDDTVDGGISFWTQAQGKHLKRFHDSDQEWEPVQIQHIESSDTLHLHCQCKGFSVVATRPKPDLPLPKGCYWYRQPLKDGIPQRYMASWCACASCRECTGSSLPAHPWVQIPFIDIYPSSSPDSHYVEGEMTTTTDLANLTRYNSSHRIARYFCSTCGATVLYFDEERSFLGTWAAGLVDAPEGSMAQSWLSWWAGQEGHPVPPIHCVDEGRNRWGQIMDEFVEGWVDWGKGTDELRVSV